MDTIKIPLSKANKAKFRDLYLKYYLKDAPSNITDEKLIKAVQDYEAKNQNQNSENGTEQKGNPNEAGSTGSDVERDEAVKRFVKIAGVEPDEKLTTEEINAESLMLENRKVGSEKYFGLFGEQPTESMTNEQIFNAIDVKESEIAKANEKPAKSDPEVSFDPEKQMLVKNKKTGEQMVINKPTFKFLQNDFEELAVVPKEIDNK